MCVCVWVEVTVKHSMSGFLKSKYVLKVKLQGVLLWRPSKFKVVVFKAFVSKTSVAYFQGWVDICCRPRNKVTTVSTLSLWQTLQ